MKKVYLFLFAIVCSLAFAGCSDDDNNKTAAAVLEIVSSDIGFDAAGGEGTITLSTAESTFEAVSDKSWLTVTGKTSTTVTYSVGEHSGALQRSARIRITAGSASREVTVLQNGAIFEIDSQAIVLDPSGQTSSLIEFDTSMSSLPEVSIPQAATEWLTATVEAGSIRLTPAMNYSGTRSAVVTVTQGWKPVEISVTQEMVDLLDVKQLAFDREPATVTVSATEFLPMLASSWNVTTEASWITLTKNGNDSFTLSVSTNDSGVLREGTVELKSPDGDVLTTVTVSQKIYSYEFFLGEWTMNYNSNQTLKVTLSAVEDRSGYIMDGLVFDGVVIGYDDSGAVPFLSMLMQFITSYSIHYVYLCPWDSVSTSFTWAEGVGANLVYNMNEASPALVFQDNRQWSNPVDSFIVWAFTTYPASSSGSAGSYARYPLITSFTR